MWQDPPPQKKMSFAVQALALIKTLGKIWRVFLKLEGGGRRRRNSLAPKPIEGRLQKPPRWFRSPIQEQGHHNNCFKIGSLGGCRIHTHPSRCFYDDFFKKILWSDHKPTSYHSINSVSSEGERGRSEEGALQLILENGRGQDLT